MSEETNTQYSKYEKARLIGARALQIAMGAPMALKLSQKDIEALGYNPIEIAKRELEAGVMPLDVRRAVRRRKAASAAQ